MFPASIATPFSLGSLDIAIQRGITVQTDSYTSAGPQIPPLRPQRLLCEMPSTTLWWMG